MKKVLLIDDSKTARIFLKRIFQEIGDWDVYEAENGEMALDQLKAIGPIDLACVDWNMPVMNGLDFIKNAKTLKNIELPWLMMVTSETEMDNVFKAMSVGANEYVMKPYNKDIILAKLEMMGFMTQSQ